MKLSLVDGISWASTIDYIHVLDTIKIHSRVAIDFALNNVL